MRRRSCLLVARRGRCPGPGQAHAPAPGARARGRHRDRRPARREPDRAAGQPGRHAARASRWSCPGLRPQALALSPDGRLLLTAGKTARAGRRGPGHRRRPPARAAARRRRPQPAGAVREHPRARQGGPDQLHRPASSRPDGRRAFLSDVNGSRGRVRRGAGRHGRASRARSACPPPTRRAARRRSPPAWPSPPTARGSTSAATCPTACSSSTPPTGRVLRTFDVGVAPYDVVLVGGKAYVSNWGGRRPRPGDLTGPAGAAPRCGRPGAAHRQRRLGEVIDLGDRRQARDRDRDRPARLRPGRVAGRPLRRLRQRGSDTLSVIDTRTDAVVETIWAKPNPADLFGAQPNALAFDAAGQHALRRNGTQNAVAVVALRPGGPRVEAARASIPVGWFPGALVFDAPRRTLHVANIKGHRARPKPYEGRRDAGAEGFNSHQYHGSLSLVPVPDDARAAALSARSVWRNLRRERIAEAPAAAAARPAAARRARADRRAEPDQARRLHHQGEPHLRPGARRHRRRATATRAVHLRRADHAQPAQAGARVRAARQHLLLRHPQRRRPPVEHDRASPPTTWRDPSPASRAAIPTAWARTRPTRWPIRPPASSGTTRSRHGKTHAQLRRVHGARGRSGATRRRRARPTSSPATATWKGESDEVVFASEPMIETIRPYLAHELRRLGDGRARPVPRRLHSSRS